MNKLKNISITDLKPFDRRDIRQHVVDDLSEDLKDGFEESLPLTVLARDGYYLVADGNHRLAALQNTDIKAVPCIVREGNPYKIAISVNKKQDTRSPEDLFDMLDTIQALKDEGLTQAEIGDVVDMTQVQISYYQSINSKIITHVLEKCKSHQYGRVIKNITDVIFNFTEGWFRS
jgi:ParB-like chromosome segregation protein Spo0J